MKKTKRPSDPFTPALMLAILNDDVLRTPPKVAGTDANVAMLVNQMNQCSRLAAFNGGQLKQEQEDTQRVRSAIEVLSMWLQQIDWIYESQLTAHRLYHAPVDTMIPTSAPITEETREYYLSRLHEEQDCLRNLHVAAQVAHALGAPRTFAKTVIPDKWESYAHLWINYFERFVPGRSTAAGYRFVVKMAPIITKESPTYDAVRSFIMRRRPLSNRQRKKNF